MRILQIISLGLFGFLDILAEFVEEFERPLALIVSLGAVLGLAWVALHWDFFAGWMSN
jgi:hypothetical protein